MGVKERTRTLGRALLGGCAALSALAAAGQAAAADLVYFGTQGRGPYAARLDPQSGRLTPLGVVGELDWPTWLAANPETGVLYAVGEMSAGVFSLSVDRATGKLRVINRAGSGGAGPAHLSVDPQSQTVFVANYGSGHVGALPIQPGGALGAAASVQADAGTGPSPRQTGPHAHAAVLDPSRRFLLAADLGADKVFIYRFDAASHTLAPAETPFEALPPGSGPRHLAFHPNGSLAFVVSELSAEVRSYRWDAGHGRLQLIQTLSTLPEGYSGVKSGAEIVVSRDGRRLYVSNRGEDTIVAYAIDAQAGTLQEIQRVSAGGKTPWGFSIDPSGRWMLVADQGSNVVTEFSVDPESGKLTSTPEIVSVPKPVDVLFLPD